MRTNTRIETGHARMYAVGLGLAVATIIAAPIEGQAVELADGNSTMNIDPMSAAGVNSWTVEGQNQLFKQWFWYRVGSGPEMSIDTLGAPSVLNTANSATITYTGLEFDLSITYLLTGGAPLSGQADLNEDVLIVNKLGEPLDFHFYQYSDFNLEGTAGGDTVFLYPETSPFALAYQYENNTGLSESIVGVNPMADRGEVGITPSILNKLNDLSTTDLANDPGPISGDVSFAFQWDLTIDTAVSISKLKNLNINVIPEPTAASLGLLGLLLAAARRINRSR